MAREVFPPPTVRLAVNEALAQVEERVPGSLRARVEHPTGATLLLLDGAGDWVTIATMDAGLTCATLSLDRANVVRLRDALNDWLTR